MNRLNRERALDRCQRTHARVGPFKLLHDESIRSVTQPRTAVFCEIRSTKAQRAPDMCARCGDLTRAMAGHDLTHDLLLHKTPRPVACRAFIVRKEFFDCVVIERGWGHPMRLW